MSKHNETGVNGEQEAAKFLEGKGYTILHRNWSFKQMEVDLIAQKGDYLVFVEVKTRDSHRFGYPEEFVTKQKQKFLKLTAEEFITLHPTDLKVQFDVVSIIMDNKTVKELVHFEDAFY